MPAKKEEKIRMRGHHLFCITMMQNWTLWGPRFWESTVQYKEKMANNPDLVIEIVPACGDTCDYCPRNDEGKCEIYDFRPGGNSIDLEILHQLGLKIGGQVTSGELMRLIKEKFNSMPSICVWGCGVTDSRCEEGLQKLKSQA